LLLTRKFNFGFHQRFGILCLAELVLARQQGMHCIQLARQQGMHSRQLALLESELRVWFSSCFLCSLWRGKKKFALKMEAVNYTERRCLPTSMHGVTPYKAAIIFSFNHLSPSLSI